MCSKIGLSVFCLMTCTQQSYAEGYTEAGRGMTRQKAYSN